VTRIYYKDAVGAIIVFDLTKRKTFEAVDTWRKDIEEKLNVDEPIPVLLIGNKVRGTDFCIISRRISAP
jgi:Ras-related protein Rab-32